MDSRVLEFGGKQVAPDIRKLSDMKDVIYDKNWLENASDKDLYYMYRDLALSRKDYSIMMEYDLRYDITIIPPSNLGMEFIKTAGHYHPNINDKRVYEKEYTYPEVYEVLNGVAHYLLQKRENSNNSKIVDVVMIEAKEGDKVIVPPNYGHVTINPSNKELKMANWVSRDFSSIYEPYKELSGAAYFELTKDAIILNDRYEHLPEVRYLKVTNISKIGLNKNKEMYGLIRDVKKLDFLNNPQDFDWLWEQVSGD
jgi:glucose-6-phosphate isomerase, archaeal